MYKIVTFCTIIRQLRMLVQLTPGKRIHRGERQSKHRYVNIMDELHILVVLLRCLSKCQIEKQMADGMT